MFLSPGIKVYLVLNNTYIFGLGGRVFTSKPRGHGFESCQVPELRYSSFLPECVLKETPKGGAHLILPDFLKGLEFYVKLVFAPLYFMKSGCLAVQLWASKLKSKNFMLK